MAAISTSFIFCYLIIVALVSWWFSTLSHLSVAYFCRSVWSFEAFSCCGSLRSFDVLLLLFLVAFVMVFLFFNVIVCLFVVEMCGNQPTLTPSSLQLCKVNSLRVCPFSFSNTLKPFWVSLWAFHVFSWLTCSLLCWTASFFHLVVVFS